MPKLFTITKDDQGLYEQYMNTRDLHLLLYRENFTKFVFLALYNRIPRDRKILSKFKCNLNCLTPELRNIYLKEDNGELICSIEGRSDYDTLVDYLNFIRKCLKIIFENGGSKLILISKEILSSSSIDSFRRKCCNYLIKMVPDTVDINDIDNEFWNDDSIPTFGLGVASQSKIRHSLQRTILKTFGITVTLNSVPESEDCFIEYKF